MLDFLSWHNSEVRCVTLPGTLGGEARVTLSAGAITRQSEGSTFKSGLSGFIKPLELVFEQALVIGPIPDCVGSIAQGELRLGSVQTHPASQIPLPWLCKQHLTLSLQFRNGSVLRIEASAAHCLPPPDATFIESYAC